MDDSKPVEVEIEEGQDISNLLFFGTEDAYETFKEKHNIKDDEEDKKKSEEASSTIASAPILSLATSTLEILDEETTKILRRTHTVHDYNEVFMQSSLDFYDEYYNKSESEVSPELRAARGLRRTYRNYNKWLEAMRIYYNYIDSLIEKHGEDNFMYKVRVGIIREWVPPVPILSKAAEGYDLYEAGIIPLEVETLSEEKAQNVLKALMEEVKDSEPEITGGIETSIGIIEAYDDSQEYSPYKSYRMSPCSSLEDVTRIFRSWYQDDKSNSSRELFRDAPENIRRRVENEFVYFYAPGLMASIVNGEYPKDSEEVEVNPNEMVMDNETGKTMTRAEFANRSFIRTLSEYGWDKNRLLQYMNVGSKLDRAKLKKKSNKKRNRNRNQDASDFYDFDTRGIDPMFSEQEGLLDTLRSLSRGD